MATVPTGKMEQELHRLYMRWVNQLPANRHRIAEYTDEFRRDSVALIERMGGRTAMLGAMADFPAPKELDLSPHIGTIYDDLKQAAISAGIATGMNPSDVARALFKAGADKSFNRLNRLARTETVSAYWKNQWDSVDGLGLVMVWGAEKSIRTCDYCLGRDGLVVADPNIRDHPNGRCTLIPTHPSQVKYKGTLQPDGSVTQDPAWSQDSKPEVDSSLYDNPLEGDAAFESVGYPGGELTAAQQEALDIYSYQGDWAMNTMYRNPNMSRQDLLDSMYKHRWGSDLSKDMEWPELAGPKLKVVEDILDKAVRANSGGLMSASHELTKPVKVYRGFGNVLGPDGKPVISNGLKTGDFLTDTSWGSTSTDSKVADLFMKGSMGSNDVDGVLYEITVPKGHRVISAKDGFYGDEEKELIMPPGTKYRVVKVVEEPAKNGYGKFRRVILEAVL